MVKEEVGTKIDCMALFPFPRLNWVTGPVNLSIGSACSLLYQLILGLSNDLAAAASRVLDTA